MGDRCYALAAAVVACKTGSCKGAQDGPKCASVAARE